MAMEMEHRWRNQGGRGGHCPPPPPRFGNVCFRAPQISTPDINQHWLEIIFKPIHDSFSCVTFMRTFVLNLYVYNNYVELQEPIQNPKFPILFRPPQVVTCSSASAMDKSLPQRLQCTNEAPPLLCFMLYFFQSSCHLL